MSSEFVDKPEEEFNSRQGRIVVGISGTVQSMWGLNNEDFRKVLYEIGKRHVEAMISEGAQLISCNLGRKTTENFGLV